MEEYFEFFIKKLNKYIDTDFILVIQHDSFILNTASRRNKFLNYDYVGVPWIGYFKDEVEHDMGNGGFSLRSKLHDILVQDDGGYQKTAARAATICRAIACCSSRAATASNTNISSAAWITATNSAAHGCNWIKS